MMNQEQKIDNSVIEIDLNKRMIKGYCKAKNFKEQFQKMRELLKWIN